MSTRVDIERLLKSTGTVALHGRDEVREFSLALVSAARRRVRIVSRHLDPSLYDTDPFCAALRALAVEGRRGRVEILVREAESLVRSGHRVLALAKRLPSFFEVRVLADQHRDFNAAFLLVDDGGFVHRTFADRFEGEGSFSSPREVRELDRVFDQMWDLGPVPPDFRRLSI